jgi:parallel beta-helix repeat protein
MGELGKTVMVTGSLGNIMGCYERSFIQWQRFTSDRQVTIAGSQGSIVAYCDISGTFANTVDNHDAIFVENVTKAHIHHNRIHGVTGLSQNSSGIKLYRSTDAIIEDNYIYSNTVGVFDKESGLRNVIRRNLFLKNKEPFYGNNQGAEGLYLIYDNVLDQHVQLHYLSRAAEIHDNLFINVNALVGAWAGKIHDIRVWNNIVISGNSSVLAFWDDSYPLTDQIGYMDFNFYTGTPNYSFNKFNTPQSFSFASMQGRGVEVHSQVLSGASAMFVDQVSYQLKSQWSASGRFGDAPGPENAAEVLDTSRYGTGSTAAPPPPPTGDQVPPAAPSNLRAM